MLKITLYCNVHDCWLSGHPLWEQDMIRPDGKEYWQLSLRDVWCPVGNVFGAEPKLILGLIEDEPADLSNEKRIPTCSPDKWDISVQQESP